MYERQCQFKGCKRVAPGNARFCSPECKRIDYNARKREDRVRFNKAVDEAMQRKLANSKRGRPTRPVERS
jgi:endogenous inhibitor of DNA gyrase (YacG/DUF329 family)